MPPEQAPDRSALFDLSPGRLIGNRYTIVAPHRQGGISTAFEVRDGQGPGRLEMQVFPAQLFARPGEAREFSAFLAPWRGVHSRSVLRLRDVLPLDRETLALITDFPPGEALRARFKARGRLEAREVIALGKECLAGLAEIHAHSLVHGDVKPSTIFVQGRASELSAVLVDGGITPALWTAKDLGEKTALIGTPYYAPVEQFGGDSPSVSSDVYNLAAVLFECLAGVLPWPGHSFLDVFQAKLDRRPPSMAERAPDVEVDQDLEHAIVRGCLADRRERYGSAREFLEALESLG
jgi:serine/threonine-protein kinase